MKVLFISSWYPSETKPGFGVFVKEHAKAINTTSADIVVLAVLVFRSKKIFSINPRGYSDETGVRTIEIVINTRFRDLIYHSSAIQKRLAYRYLKKHVFSSFMPDIIHSNVVFPAGIIGNFIARKINKPHVITEHWSKIAGLLHKPYLSSLALKAYRNAQAILPVSEFLKKTMQQLLPGISASRFHIVPNVVDNKTFTFTAKKQNPETLHFCAVATWTTKKNPDKMPELFMEALNIVAKKTEKRLHLTMVGGGERVNELRELASKLSYQIDFMGHKTKSEIADIMQNSDFFVHASTVETFGIVTAEALLTGTPVICSNAGALPELVNYTNGILCENTVEDWVKGIESAINTRFETEKMAESLKEKFSYQSVGSQIESIYLEIMST